MFFGARDIFGLGRVAQRGAWGLHVGSEALQKWLVARGSNWNGYGRAYRRGKRGSHESCDARPTSPVRQVAQRPKNQGHPLSKASLQNGDRFS